ncbi:hypothetical protein IE53DRAFT_378828 [Violaceomyces palustris]|uniref:Uncharacterized protein n=1 Tax=Violaceomyces palustris TaxID=1673888 RepID=A0ACD0P0H8_9BASI|nr:hypothetical protein IE53DRAFT_378828 [Violaceomyces palustris]
MTASGVHDLTPGFTWKDEYQKQLEHIAETDEVDQNINWTNLKDAIKYKIIESLAGFPENPSPTLHAAALLIPLANNEDLEGPHDASYATEASSNSIPVQGVQPSSFTSTAAAEAAAGLVKRFAGEGTDIMAFASAHGIHPEDEIGFYASKTQPPPDMNGSWGRKLDKGQLERERDVVFGMLDEFDTQPPFTIQRLCELVVTPQRHQKTSAKYLSALQRLLAVTATRDAFPISPDTLDPVMPEANGLLPDGSIPPLEGSNGSASTSYQTSRPRTLSSASQSSLDRHSQPLFSPIPFLIRDAPGENGAESVAKEALAEVPEFELSGADRTHEEPEEKVHAAVDVAMNSSELEGEDSVPQDGTAGMATTEGATLPQAGIDLQKGVSGALATSPIVTNEGSLGVPTGRVDELDDGTASGQGKMDNEYHPLSSTTEGPVKGPGNRSEVIVEDDCRRIKRIRSDAQLKEEFKTLQQPEGANVSNEMEMDPMDPSKSSDAMINEKKEDVGKESADFRDRASKAAGSVEAGKGSS